VAAAVKRPYTDLPVRDELTRVKVRLATRDVAHGFTAYDKVYTSHECHNTYLDNRL